VTVLSGFLAHVFTSQRCAKQKTPVCIPPSMPVCQSVAAGSGTATRLQPGEVSTRKGALETGLKINNVKHFSSKRSTT
jgi:hypothetical protein